MIIRTSRVTYEVFKNAGDGMVALHKQTGGNQLKKLWPYETQSATSSVTLKELLRDRMNMKYFSNGSDSVN